MVAGTTAVPRAHDDEPRLDIGRAAALREVAKEEGRSQQESVKLALAQFFTNRRRVRRREEAIDRIVARSAELNELLAQ